MEWPSAGRVPEQAGRQTPRFEPLMPGPTNSISPDHLPFGNRRQPRAAHALAPQASRENFRWIVWPLVMIVVALPIAIVIGARPSQLTGLLMSYANALIIIMGMIFFLTRRTFESVIPVVFLIWPLLSFPLATIYFGLSDPDAWYITTQEQHRPFLDNNIRVQAATMLFLVSYLFVVIVLRPRGSKLPTFSIQNRATKRLVMVATGLSMFSFAGGLYARVTQNYESGFGYLLAGTFNYLFAIPMIIGVLFPKIPKAVKTVALTFFAVTSPVYLLYHSRLNLIGPWVMMAVGLLLFSEWPQRKKITLLVSSLFILPFLLIIGEVTRGVRPGLTLQERTQALGQWQGFLQQSSFFGSTMGRFFSTGGHSIITLSPEEIPYFEFDPASYLTEMVVSTIVPGRIWANYVYSTTYHLNRYGLRVTTSTSVELSLPGSLWMLGGWVPMVLGGIWVGLLMAGLMRWLSATTRRSPYQGLFYLTMTIGSVLWAFNYDPISLTRSLVRSVFVAWLLWHVAVKNYLGPSATKVGLERRPTYPMIPQRA